MVYNHHTNWNSGVQIDLLGNSLGDDGIQLLCESLIDNSTIASLNISSLIDSSRIIQIADDYSNRQCNKGGGSKVCWRSFIIELFIN